MKAQRTQDVADTPTTPLTLLRDLLITIALSCLITIGLLHCIAMYLTLFFPPTLDCASCSEPDVQPPWSFILGLDLHADLDVQLTPLQRAVAAITYADVLRVTTGFGLLVFVAVEVGSRRRRRCRDLEDAELGTGSIGVGFDSEKHTKEARPEAS
ncbi:hypothetical protein MKEN_00926800 [Mycena kentingensis (nom. inval.)]|nr:hypothetical protein MKEN_00926800 [Mycena kentingensis (nom. inval.)]